MTAKKLFLLSLLCLLLDSSFARAQENSLFIIQAGTAPNTSALSTATRPKGPMGSLLPSAPSSDQEGNLLILTNNGGNGGNTASIEQTGVNERVILNQAGNANVASVQQSGSDNLAMITQMSSGNVASLIQTGRGNVAMIRQN